MLDKIKKKLTYTEIEELFYDETLQRSYNGISVCAGTLKDKNVLITGGSSGIGLAIAKRFLAEGCFVVITGRNESKLKSAINNFKDEKGRIKYIVMDQTDFNNMKEHLYYAEKLFPDGKIDVLINNAGIYTDVDKKRKFRSVTEKEYDNVIRTNLKSSYFLSCLVANQMREDKRKGNIVNIASICAFFNNYKYTPYGMSKSGIIKMTQVLHKKYSPVGIAVNYIAPGSVATGMGNLGVGSNIAKFCNVVHRTMLPEEIAAVAALQVGLIGNYTTGIVVSACEIL